MVWNFSLSDALSRAFASSENITAERSIRVTGQPNVASTNASPASPAVVSNMLGVILDFNPMAFDIACPRPPPNCCRCAREPLRKSIEMVVLSWRSNNSIRSSWNKSCKSYWSFFLFSSGSSLSRLKSLACCWRNFEKQTTAIVVSLEMVIYLLWDYSTLVLTCYDNWYGKICWYRCKFNR